MPSRAVFESSPLAVQFRDDLPVVLQRSPDHLAVIYAYARELERVMARLMSMRSELWPQSAVDLLPVFERATRLPVGQNGASIEERRAGILAALRNAQIGPSGREWGAGLTRIVGPGWKHQEYGSGQPDPPDGALQPYEVAVTIPAKQNTALWNRVRAYLDEEGPTHVHFRLYSSLTFQLDISKLDVTSFE